MAEKNIEQPLLIDWKPKQRTLHQWRQGEIWPNIVPFFFVTIGQGARGRQGGKILSYLVSHLQGDPANHHSSVQCGEADWATPSVSPHRVKMFALAWLNSTFAYQTINILAVALHCYQGGAGTCTLCRSGASVNTFYAACNHSLVCQYNSFSDFLSQSVKRSLFLDIQYEKFFTLCCLVVTTSLAGRPVKFLIIPESSTSPK